MKFQTLIVIVVIGAAGLVAYDHFRPRPAPAVAEAPPPRRRIVVNANPVEDRSWIKPKDGQAPAASASPYQCDGRTMCSQMRSCAEAEYFIQHCPGTKMDGDGDGVPCEQQWCS